MPTHRQQTTARSQAGQRYAARIDLRSGVSDADVWIKKGVWVLVKSTNVRAIMYDKAAQRLYVTFRNGSRYFYPGINVREAKKTFYAASQGKNIWRLRRAGWKGYKY